MGAAGCRPTKLRVLDLPFTAVEWVAPLDRPLMQQATPDQWVAWQRSPHAGGVATKPEFKTMTLMMHGWCSAGMPDLGVHTGYFLIVSFYRRPVGGLAVQHPCRWG